MKSNDVKSILILLMVLVLVGCMSISDSIAEEEAKQLVLEQHTRNIGTPEIIAIDIKRNAYYIEWENKENREWGIDKVTKNGEVKMIEATIE